MSATILPGVPSCPGTQCSNICDVFSVKLRYELTLYYGTNLVRTQSLRRLEIGPNAESESANSPHSYGGSCRVQEGIVRTPASPVAVAEEWLSFYCMLL